MIIAFVIIAFTSAPVLAEDVGFDPAEPPINVTVDQGDVQHDGSAVIPHPNRDSPDHYLIINPDGTVAEHFADGKVKMRAIPEDCDKASIANETRRECQPDKEGEPVYMQVTYKKYTCRKAPFVRRIVISREVIQPREPCDRETYTTEGKTAERLFGEKWKPLEEEEDTDGTKAAKSPQESPGKDSPPEKTGEEAKEQAAAKLKTDWFLTYLWELWFTDDLKKKASERATTTPLVPWIKVTYRKDKTEVYDLPGGITVEKRPDGTIIEKRPDGTEHVRNPDGTYKEHRAATGTPGAETKPEAKTTDKETSTQKTGVRKAAKPAQKKAVKKTSNQGEKAKGPGVSIGIGIGVGGGGTRRRHEHGSPDRLPSELP